MQEQGYRSVGVERVSRKNGPVRHSERGSMAEPPLFDALDPDPSPVGDGSGFVVSSAVAAEAERATAPGQDIADGLPTWERELVADALEAESALVGTGTNSWE